MNEVPKDLATRLLAIAREHLGDDWPAVGDPMLYVDDRVSFADAVEKIRLSILDKANRDASHATNIAGLMTTLADSNVACALLDRVDTVLAGER